MKKIISLILLIGWMVLIFMLSNQNSTVSMNESGKVIEFISSTSTTSNSNIDLWQIIIRKTAHILEYLVLYLLMYNYIRFYSKNPVKLSIILTLIYACIDESHQLFVDGRDGKPLDILIDSIGIFIGYIIEVLYEKKIKKRISN